MGFLFVLDFLGVHTPFLRPTDLVMSLKVSGMKRFSTSGYFMLTVVRHDNVNESAPLAVTFLQWRLQ